MSPSTPKGYTCPYPSLDIACRSLGVTLYGRMSDWRLCEPRVGKLTGLPNCRGTLVATDGIIALVERLDGVAFFVHLEWFNLDRKERESKQQKPTFERLLLEGLV